MKDIPGLDFVSLEMLMTGANELLQVERANKSINSKSKQSGSGKKNVVQVRECETFDYQVVVNLQPVCEQFRSYIKTHYRVTLFGGIVIGSNFKYFRGLITGLIIFYRLAKFS